MLAHGIWDSSARFRNMRAALLERGLGPVFAMDFSPRDASIPFQEMGNQVQEAVERLLGESDAGEVDIVAFSMGALAARYYIQRLGGSKVVRKFISISAPHHGSLLAWFSSKPGVKQIRPGSDFLQGLHRDPDPWKGVEGISFWTLLDLMILPCWSSYLQAVPNRVFLVPVHPWMLTTRRVIKAVITFLQA